jgi:hypothetical protein
VSKSQVAGSSGGPKFQAAASSLVLAGSGVSVKKQKLQPK